MAEIFDLDVTDGNNTGRFPEGQAPSTVNNGARALEGILARGFRDTIIPDRTTTGSANAQVLTPNETIAALAAAMSHTWKAGYTNTGAMTLNVVDTAATGAKSVKMTNGEDPYAGAVTAGGYYRTVYDGTNQILMNPSPLAQPGPASTTQSGIVELATDAETQALSDATRAVTPANLGALAASTTQSGIVELATDAETQTGTDTGRAVTPAGYYASTLGWGQAWQNVTGSRSVGTEYTNSTGKPIAVSVWGSVANSNKLELQVNDGGGFVTVSYAVTGAVANTATVSAIVPAGHTYRIASGGGTPVGWAELR